LTHLLTVPRITKHPYTHAYKYVGTLK